MNPTRTVRRYLMIGAPVTSVRTPPLLTSYLAGKGIPVEIEARHVEAGALAEFMRGVRHEIGIDGLLVTMPHKKSITRHLDLLSTVARAAESVNAVKRLQSGALAGAQFDGVALIAALMARNVPLAASDVLLAGLGGAGLAIARALTAHGCARLAIREADQRLLDRLVPALQAGARCPVTADRSVGEGRYHILINATPLGMGDADPSPFASVVVKRAGFIADIVADPRRTRLQEMAEQAGIPILTGREMVHGQIAPIGDWLRASAVAQ